MKLIEPRTKTEFEAYYDLRWRILRKPWELQKGSEKDELDKSSYHLMVLDESTGNEVVLKKGRFGPYLKSGDKMKSLPPGVSEETLTPEIALATIAMPTEIGIDKTTNLPIMKDIGRYGPYLKCGKNNRKISPPDDVLTINLETP